MASGVRTRYHVAINGKGFMLRGSPQNPSYSKQDAPSLVNSLPVQEVSYNELNASGWRWWAQTDWSGGFQQLKWKDNASFRDGQGIEPIDKFGNLSLQHDFTSAVSISGSHKYSSHAVHGTDLLLGSVQSVGAKLFKITSANTLSTISAYTGAISAVNSISRFGDVSLIGLTRLSGTVKTLSKWNGSTLSAFRNTNPIVRAVKGIGIRAYISERIASLSGDQLLYATNLSAFTSAYNAGKSREIPKIEDLNGSPYFFIEEGTKVEFLKWDELSEKAVSIYTFNDLTNWGVRRYLTFLIITGTSAGTKVAFAFNGARLWQIFRDELDDTSYDFSKPFVHDEDLQLKGARWDGKFWFPGLYGKFATVQYTPFANFTNKAYGFAVTGTLLKVAYYDTSKYQISGNVIGSNFGHDIGAVDKLVNAVDVNTKALAASQVVEIFRSTDEGQNFTSVGTLKFATEGALAHKRLYFPSGFVTKTWLYKAQLVGPGTSTPTVLDISHQYMPVPDMKRRWALGINANNKIQLLNNQEEERDSKALMSELWEEKDSKRTVIFEDVDAFSAKIISAMTSANTSARIKGTRLMPEKGRIRAVVSGVAEEMRYTSARGGILKGITRALKGTKARAYTSAHSFDNNYAVIVTDIQEQVVYTDEKKTESVSRVVLLEV